MGREALERRRPFLPRGSVRGSLRKRDRDLKKNLPYWTQFLLEDAKLDH
jgi:hypothetical protein